MGFSRDLKYVSLVIAEFQIFQVDYALSTHRIAPQSSLGSLYIGLRFILADELQFAQSELFSLNEILGDRVDVGRVLPLWPD